RGDCNVYLSPYSSSALNQYNQFHLAESHQLKATASIPFKNLLTNDCSYMGRFFLRQVFDGFWKRRQHFFYKWSRYFIRKSRCEVRFMNDSRHPAHSSSYNDRDGNKSAF